MILLFFFNRVLLRVLLVCKPAQNLCFVNDNLLIYVIVDDNTKWQFLVLHNLSALKENSLKEWSIKKAIRIQTYSTYDPIPVPFNLISSLLLGLRSMWRCLCCCLDRRNGNVSNELDWNELSTLLKGHNYKLQKQTFLKKVHWTRTPLTLRYHLLI